jgi:bifunctional oligoribonuclease and PAP phosphatase NrnA
MSPTTLNEVAAVLRPARRILMICHVAPDGDAIGSLLGLGWLLRGLPLRPGGSGAQPGERRLAMVCDDGVPAPFGFLPGAADVLTDPPTGPWDVVVSLDASDPARLGRAFRPREYGQAPLVVIDHHVTNMQFGTLNWVDTRAAATAQVLVDLADALDAEIDGPTATCLLTGLVTDTRGFRTSNTTLDVMRTATRLMQAGADLANITERALNYKPYNLIRLWGPALGRVRLQQRVIWTSITQDMRAAISAPDNGDSGLVSLLIDAPEANVSAVFNEKPDGNVEVGFRSKPGYDVSAVALSLGGGGHPQASGCTIAGPLADAEARVSPLLFAAAARDVKREA